MSTQTQKAEASVAAAMWCVGTKNKRTITEKTIILV